MSEYIHFVEALERLSHRMDAKAYELAAWVYWTEEHGGLPAFITANEPYATSRFTFDRFSEVPEPLVDQLAWAWFLRDDIESFAPGTRFTTARELIERWSLSGGASGASLVRSAIEGSLLLPADPYSDPFEPALPGSEAFPVRLRPVKWCNSGPPPGPYAASCSMTAGCSSRRRTVPIASRLMYLRPTCHSSVCSASSAPTRRTIEASFGKIPTTLDRRLISLFSRSSVFVDASCGQCSSGSP